MATQVNWCVFPFGPEPMPFDAMLDMAPVKVLTQVLTDPDRSYVLQQEPKGAAYGRCPAFIDYMKNTYALVAPFDVEVTIDENGCVLQVVAPSPQASELVVFRTAPSRDTNLIISLADTYLFYSKDEVRIEQLPPFMDYSLMRQGVTIIPGTYDISKWVRPVEVAMEIKKGVRSIRFAAGTPLSYLRFVTPNNDTVKLNKVEYTPELRDTSAACTGLKAIRNNLSLTQCYAYGKRVVDKFLRPKRCPFGFGRKV